MSRNILICDFDETITVKDTIALLARLAYRVNPKLKPEWSHFEATYMNGYNELQHTYLMDRCLPLLSNIYMNHTKITDGNFQDLFQCEIKYQKLCRNIELNSMKEMEKYNVFKGITTQDVIDYVDTLDELVIRQGFLNCLKVLDIQLGQLYILSINWSREFIRNVISSSYVRSSNIYCNALLHDTTRCRYSGLFSKQLLTGSDKIHTLQEICQCTGEDKTIWYIGDSETDLLSILYPEINGILLLDPEENEKKFNKITKEILGIESETLSKFYIKDTRYAKFIEKENDMASYLVKTWTDVTTLIQSHN
ncbi:hypothetical protein C6P45_002893 [Maudiozyma exigua]|uniref:Haloacid dehalogenase-like hydrolase n=1 Tax=Maudiozyma exigua TaxID=34358 RepID=A0A9P7B325_MAUEX|nr:hypothetical protein C6P45_002893 [Kazachstania exigua]